MQEVARCNCSLKVDFFISIQFSVLTHNFLHCQTIVVFFPPDLKKRKLEYWICKLIFKAVVIVLLDFPVSILSLFGQFASSCYQFFSFCCCVLIIHHFMPIQLLIQNLQHCFTFNESCVQTNDTAILVHCNHFPLHLSLGLFRPLLSCGFYLKNCLPFYVSFRFP